MSTIEATIHICFHQCTKCGILYAYENKSLCRMPFNCGKCPKCHLDEKNERLKNRRIDIINNKYTISGSCRLD